MRARCGLLQNKLTLAAGESRTLYYFIGFCESAHALVGARAAMLAEAEEPFAPERAERFGRLRTRCPDARFNTVFNYWAEKQVSYCAIGKKAVRDNAQLAMGFLNFDTVRAKEVLAECLARQYRDGHCVLLWYPVTDTKLYSDPAFWLGWAVCEYIKETGEFSFLDEEFPWLDGGGASVAEHLKAAARWYADPANAGPHGLPKLYYADWNDALNIPDENAESVFMAECVCLLMREFAELFARAGDEAFSASRMRSGAGWRIGSMPAPGTAIIMCAPFLRAERWGIKRADTVRFISIRSPLPSWAALCRPIGCSRCCGRWTAPSRPRACGSVRRPIRGMTRVWAG